MRTILLLTIILATSINLKAQESYGISLNEITIQDLPALQSFAWGRSGDKILIIGGRKDGLHKRRPFEAFLATGNNTELHVLDLATKTFKSASLSVLSVGLNEQLQSTNMNYEQVEDKLYIAGGYAYSSTAADHITFDKMTIVDVPAVISAIESSSAIDSYFTQITDTLFKVTGGYMDFIDGEFYLVGGQNFEGRYNPMGPTHGPGFVQKYTDQIRRFKIAENAGVFSLTDVKVQTNSPVLHRRDYNLTPQIFPNGDVGLTAFTGVFQLTADLPWLDVVDIRNDTFELRTGFQQLLNQYHTAHLSMHDAILKRNHTLFFGGIGQYTIDANGNLVEDTDVPFVKTISQVTRDENDSLFEMSYALQMPALLGSGAEFFSVDDNSLYDQYDILALNAVPNTRTLIGYIYGGIESSAPNVFFDNAANTSWASARLFEVYLDKSTNSIEDWSPVGVNNDMSLKVYPNPSFKDLIFEYELNHKASYLAYKLMNIDGSTILQKGNLNLDSSEHKLDVSTISSGIYLLELKTDLQRVVRKVSIGTN